jgi:hypothetical protein
MRLMTAAIILIAVFSKTASAAQFSYTLQPDGTAASYLNGQIVAGDSDAFASMLSTLSEQGHRVIGSVLDSPGGLVGEAAKIARIVSTNGIDVAVPAGAQCVSACFLIFAQGRQKHVSENARIGVHGASVGGVETTDSQATTLIMARAASELHVPQSVVAKIVTTPPSEIAWLTTDELQAMGGVMTGPQRALPPSRPTPST